MDFTPSRRGRRVRSWPDESRRRGIGRGNERVIVRARCRAFAKGRRSDTRTAGQWREETAGEKEKEKEKEKQGMGDHHRNDRSDGLGRPSTTRDLPDVAGMNESAHIRTVYETTKGL